MANVNANIESFNKNIDVLEYIRKNCDDDSLIVAIDTIELQMYGGFYAAFADAAAALFDVGEVVIKGIIDSIASACPYIAAIKAVRDITDVLFGISKDIKQEYKIVCYGEMSEAYSSLLQSVIRSDVQNSKYIICENNEDDSIRYFANLVQIRILGEREFYNWQECEGWLGFIGNAIIDIDSIKHNINSNIRTIKRVSDMLHLSLSENMKYEVE